MASEALKESVMAPSEIFALLSAYVETDTEASIIIEGPPGCAKTALPHQVAEKHKIPLFLSHPVFHEPIEYSGVPSVEKGRTRWNKPYLKDIFDSITSPFEIDWEDLPQRAILCIDELGQAEPPMQKAWAPVLNDRRLAGIQIPRGWLVVATANRQSDRAGSSRILTHLRSRVVRVQLEPCLQDFQAWGLRTGKIHNLVRAFLEFKPEQLLQFDPVRDQQDANPRSWELVSRLFDSTPRALRRQVVAGCVGNSASEFIAFVENYDALTRKYPWSVILKDPKKAALPNGEEHSVRYALAASAAEQAKDADKKMLTGIMEYVVRLPAEFTTLAVRSIAATLYNIDKAKGSMLYNLPVFQDWSVKNADVLGGLGFN